MNSKSKQLRLKKSATRMVRNKRGQVQTTLKTDKVYRELFEDIVSIINKAYGLGGKAGKRQRSA